MINILPGEANRGKGIDYFIPAGPLHQAILLHFSIFAPFLHPILPNVWDTYGSMTSMPKMPKDEVGYSILYWQRLREPF